MKNEVKNLVHAILIGALAAPAMLGQETTRTAVKPAPREQRVGVDLSQSRRLTLREAITMALENNRDIEVERLNVQLNEFDLRAAQGIYDPSLADENVVVKTEDGLEMAQRLAH